VDNSLDDFLGSQIIPSMNFDPLFEDLEARFSASEAIVDNGFSMADLSAVTSIELLLQSSVRQTLIAPVLGQGFVGGLDSTAPNWVGVPMTAIRSMTFGYDPSLNLPNLIFSVSHFEDHLQQLPLPAKCNFRTLNPDDGLVDAILLDVDFGLLFLQLGLGQLVRPVPLVQVTQLRIWVVDNLSKDS
jgi:hypothetical protein